MTTSARKGQFLSLDISLAIIVFVGIVVVALFLWDFAKAKSDEIDLRRDMSINARQAMQALLETGGDPPSWEEQSGINSSSLRSLGITDTPFTLSHKKLQLLSIHNATAYNTTYKNALGLQGYEFRLRTFPYLTSQKRFSSVEEYVIGKAPGQNVSEIATQERVVAYNKTWERVVLEVWRDG